MYFIHLIKNTFVSKQVMFFKVLVLRIRFRIYSVLIYTQSLMKKIRGVTVSSHYLSRTLQLLTLVSVAIDLSVGLSPFLSMTLCRKHSNFTILRLHSGIKDRGWRHFKHLLQNIIFIRSFIQNSQFKIYKLFDYVL